MEIAQCDRRLLATFKATSQVCGLGVVFIGCLVLLGWAFDIEVFKGILPQWVAMKANTAVGFVLSGLGLYFLQSTRKLQRQLVKGCALVATILGILTLSEYVFGWNLGIDQLLFPEAPGAIATSSPGRMSALSASHFILLGTALLLLTGRIVPYRLIQGVALSTALIDLQIVIGYTYGVKPIFGLGLYIYFALHTAIAFLLLSIGILLVTSDRGFMSLFVSNTAGGITARALIPAAFAVPFGLGWLCLLGERLGWFGDSLGLSFHVTGNIVAFMELTWYCTKHLYRVDIQRQQAESALRNSYAQLEQRVQERTNALRESEERFRRAILDAPLPIILHAENGEILQINHAWTEITGYRPEEIPTIADWTEKAYGMRQEQMRGAIARLYQLTERTPQGEHPVRTNTGETRIWDFYSAPLGKLPDSRSMVMTMAIDITERKQAEADLQKYKDIFQFAEHALAISRGSVIELINPAFARMHDYRVEELLGKPILDLFPPECHTQVLTFMQQVGETGHLAFESQHLRKDGTVFPVFIDVTTVKDEQGNLLYRIVNVIDITERKQTEAALQDSEALARARAEELEIFLEAIPVAVWIAHDPECHHMTNNRAAYAMMRRQPGLIMTATPASGEYPFDFQIQKNGKDIPPNELPMQKAARTRQSVEAEFEFVFNDGEVKFLDSRSVPLLDHAGNVRGVIGAFWDVTELRTALSLRQQAEERFSRAILDAPLPIMLHTEDGEVLQLNHAWTEISGYSIEDTPTIEAWVNRAYRSNKEQVQVLANIASIFPLQGKTQIGEYSITTHTGENRIWDFHAAPVGQLPDGRKLIIATAIDITERKQAENERNQFFNLSLDMMCIAGVDGYFKQVNPAWSKILGYGKEELLAEPYLNFVHPEDQLQTSVEAKNHAGGTPSDTFENRYRCKDGSYKWLEWKTFASHDTNSLYAVARDVTERKQVQHKLEEQAATLQRQADLLELTYEAIIVRDQQGAITYWNRGAETMYGWQREEAIGRVTHSLLQTQTPAGIDLDQVVMEQERWQGELIHTCKDDQKMIVESRQVLIRDQQGKPTGFLEVNRDITERKRIEQEQQMLVSIVENSPDFIGTANLDGGVTYLNPAGRAMIGLSATAPINHMQVPDFHPPEYQELILNQVLPTIMKQGYWEGENLLRNSSTQEVIPILQIAFINRDRTTGQPLSLATISRDIRERKQAEKKLRASEERFRATFNQAAVGIAHVALDGRWLRVNQKLCDIVGYSYEEMRQKTFQEITHPDDLEVDLAYAQQLFAGEIQTYSMEKRYIHKDGSVIWIGLTASLLRKSEGTPDYFIGVVQDISDRKTAELAVKQLNETLEQRVQERTAQLAEVNQELKRFAYTVSHDLRSPLRAIRGLIEALVEDNGDQLDELGQEYAQHIADSAQRMDTLIQDLLAYSRLSQTQIQLQTVDLTTLMQDILVQLEPERQAKQAEITVAMPLPQVIGQRTILTQAIINILTNALKYVSAGVEPQIQIWAEKRENWIRIWIADNGIGIESEFQERIFGVFERLHGADTYSGSGVGLAIVQKGIERLKGRVGVESELGQGSRFWIELLQA
ncbi:PAS domain S-box protein [Nostoc sp. FACHB-152]|uniref:PAS domain-containing sensor histidine kinase n=1 Tax=unclassified Nostoc TaxID=2593658 RepID=UPI0016829D9C|nr:MULTISPECIES: PAS domain S-box protein [unclassified Nostoc]MBD2448680.1 PAS domain S-box protein [Nostoc sp. FACHB-152]MBD2468335.1 PAS domain S-box protein [Nostoc sp. FACHB-145]